MNKINTYGLKMKGLKAVCSESKRLKPYAGQNLQLVYYTKNGCLKMFSHIGNSHIVLNPDEDAVSVGHIYSPKSMQEISDMVHKAVEADKDYRRVLEEERKYWESLDER